MAHHKRGDSGGFPAAGLSQAAPRSGWLGFLPVPALEDRLGRLGLEAAQEVEEEEEGNDGEGDGWELPTVFTLPRHVKPEPGPDPAMQTWRMRERMKTVSVALVLCQNVGVDPPDVTKTQPCARQECWVDPLSLNPQRALETIGANLQRQYERWQPRARYRQSLDPTVEEVRRLATGLRRSARDERVLFHYNGHGVPRPTANGEIWVFNRSYTQYIPLSIYDLQTWMGSPSIYVYDCNNAGIIVESFKNFADQHEREHQEQVRAGAGAGLGEGELPAPPSLRNCIQLAACSRDQLLPMNPELPADLFTSCLTTPIKVALRWFVMRHDHGHLAPGVKLDMLEKIPGQFGDRRTMLGELNWIFTAITDTIAWNTLPRDAFQKLFRQDLLVASLFRNFLLAERIMKSHDCSPVSAPQLPDTHQHPMWDAWDLAVDICLSQLRGILEQDRPYLPSSFFEEQLTAFEVWLSYGSEERSPPEQLPIVLQVLLSQAHRLRALDLLGRFLDLGPWAVNLALSVGIFPYVLKLLQSSARELRPLLVFIWAKILAVDPSCQHDLVRDQSHKYFLTVLQDPAVLVQHKTWAVFVLSSVVQGYRQGQDEAVAGNLISICLNELEEGEPVYRQWLCICLATLWERHEEARWRAARCNAPESLLSLTADPVPEVRAAAVFALATFINSCTERSELANTLDQNIVNRLLQQPGSVLEDGSPLVRRELVVCLQHCIASFPANFLALMRALESREEEVRPGQAVQRRSVVGLVGGAGGSAGDLQSLPPGPATPRRGRRSVVAGAEQGSLAGLAALASHGPTVTKFKPFYLRVVGGLQVLERDPCSEVCGPAKQVVDSLQARLVAGGLERCVSQQQLSHHGSISAPGSPARPSFLVGSSPPCSHNTTLPSIHSSSASLTLQAPASLDPSPVTPGFLAWSARHFSARLGLPAQCELSDPESEAAWARRWQVERGEAVRARAAAERRSLEEGSGRLEEPLGVARVGGAGSTVLAWEPHTALLAAGGVASTALVCLGPDSPPAPWPARTARHTHTSSLVLLNSASSPLLAAGSDDGLVRVWGAWQSGTPHLVTGWVGLPELVPGRGAGVGLQLAWSQHSQLLAAGGEARLVRVWDCSTETRTAELDCARADCGVTKLAWLHNTALLAASFQDGRIVVWDTRVQAGAARVAAYREHDTPVLALRAQEHGRLVSGCGAGRVKVWDLRRQASLDTVEVGPASLLDIHPAAPLAAVWSPASQLSLHSLQAGGQLLNTIRQGPSPTGSLTALALHPNLLQLAAASPGSVAFYGYRKH